MSQRYLIRTFGCQMNEHDSERLAGMLEGEGYIAATDVNDADVVVLNTCCIRENADNKLYGHLGHLHALKAERPELQIVVGGCLAQKDRELIQQRAPHVDVVFGTHNVGHAADLMRRARESGPVLEILEEFDEFPSALPVRRDVPWSAWVTIQVGCDNTCAFCIVPSVRGVEVSRPFGEIIAEVEALAAEGVTEVTLLGQNVNSYGRDLTLAARDGRGSEAAHAVGELWRDDRRARPLFADLLRAVGAVDGIRRVRFTSPHPKDLRPETIAAMAETPEACPSLHLPLQSGSDRTLAAMRRGYTAERYMARLAEARAGVPDLAVSTDLIVGFPGETDADFEATLAVVAAASFDQSYTFQFSPRPGTAAAERTDEFVAADVVRERFDRLKVVVERSALERHRARVGRREEVIVEGPSKRDENVLSGRTPQNKLVHFPAPESAIAPGSFALVDIVDAAPHFLRATFVETVARARHRRRIPLAIG